LGTSARLEGPTATPQRKDSGRPPPPREALASSTTASSAHAPTAAGPRRSAAGGAKCGGSCSSAEPAAKREFRARVRTVFGRSSTAQPGATSAPRPSETSSALSVAQTHVAPAPSAATLVSDSAPPHAPPASLRPAGVSD
jgi:hypothetical protein